MKNMTLERITEVCGGVYYGSEADKKKEIAGAVIDSRQVESGYLFIACLHRGQVHTLFLFAFLSDLHITEVTMLTMPMLFTPQIYHS